MTGGASHTGKTNLAQKLLEKYKYPYLSIDHLKMGLIRSGNTDLTPTSGDTALTEYLWNIVREIVKTVIENEQDLIIEGYYIPFDWQADLDESYLSQIRYVCLIMSERYIKTHFEDIRKYASVIEQRLDDPECTIGSVLRDNALTLDMCKRHNANYLLIDDEYCVDPELFP